MLGTPVSPWAHSTTVDAIFAAVWKFVCWLGFHDREIFDPLKDVELAEEFLARNHSQKCSRCGRGLSPETDCVSRVTFGIHEKWVWKNLSVGILEMGDAKMGDVDFSAVVGPFWILVRIHSKDANETTRKWNVGVDTFFSFVNCWNLAEKRERDE